MRGAATRFLSLGLSVLATEGWRSLRDRLLDRLAESRRRRRYRQRPPRGAARRGAAAAPVLNVLGVPLAARLGGVPIQLLRRLEEERRHRPTACLYPLGGRLRLEVDTDGARWRAEWAGGGRSEPTAPRDPRFEEAVRESLRLLGSRILHLEGLAGQPEESILALAAGPARLVVSVHDFAAFCPRPHLLERATGRFCEFCREADRCAPCLGLELGEAAALQDRRRDEMGEILRRAERVVYPSPYLRDRYRELFAGLDPARQVVIEPGVPETGRAAVQRRGSTDRPLHVALLGGARPVKGSEVLEGALALLAESGRSQRFRFTVFGASDADADHSLTRHPRVRVRGFYRAGTLGRLLRREEVDLALVLSPVPETYSLALHESLDAGVPVAAFAIGAAADAIERTGCGFLLPLAAGGAGVSALLLDLVEHPERLAARSREIEVARPGAAAEAMLALYDELAATG